MTHPPSWLLPALAATWIVLLPAYAWLRRGRPYASFTLVLLLLSLPAALALEASLSTLHPGSAALLGWSCFAGLLATGLHFSSLVRARLRPRWVRYGISLPGMAFLALGAMSLPYWMVMGPLRGGLHLAGAGSAIELLRWLDWLPVVVIVAGIVSSLTLRRETVRVVLRGEEPEQFQRMPVERRRRRRRPSGAPDELGRPLRVVQITDPHLGPWQPIHRLQRRLQELVEHSPDLVLLTGDFLTMEGNGTPGALARALEPLQALPGRCFAIFGNHDHEAPEEVQSAMAANGVRLLLDDEARVETDVGPVQILGVDWSRREQTERIGALLERFPRVPDHLRLLLLHDPLRFPEIPKGAVDLTLSGHTHGGQVGLVSFGLDWTVLSRSRWPDHGLFGHGSNRLYVHRGTGFYGFPLRIGVPGELSVLELSW